MEPLKDFMRRRCVSWGSRFVWRDFEVCACDPEYDERSPYPQTLEDLGVKEIEERSRRLIEKDYNENQVYSYDYRFSFDNEPGYVYILESNVRMNKFFSGKWHWFGEGIRSRLYKIKVEDYVKTEWPVTFPVDEYGRVCLFGDSYREGDREGSYHSFEPPYSNLNEWSIKIPFWAVEIKEIPEEWADCEDTPQKVAMILLFRETGQFSSGK